MEKRPKSTKGNLGYNIMNKYSTSLYLLVHKLPISYGFSICVSLTQMEKLSKCTKGNLGNNKFKK